MTSSWWKRSLTQPQNGHSTKTGARVHNGVRWYKGKQPHHRWISFLSKPKDVSPVTHAVLVHNQGTQQPALLLSVLISPFWALLHTHPAWDQAYRPLLATGKSIQACIQTHTRMHNFILLLLQLLLCLWTIQTELSLNCSLWTAERLPAAIIICNLTSPCLQKAICKNSLRKSLSSPAQSKMVSHGHGSGGRQEQAGRWGCWW